MTKDVLDGAIRKENGMERVMANVTSEWREAAMAILKEVAAINKFFIVDSVRQLAKQRNLPEPHSHASWGALFNAAAKQGLIKKTYRYRLSELKSNNAGVRNIWQSQVFQEKNDMELAKV